MDWEDEDTYPWGSKAAGETAQADLDAWICTFTGQAFRPLHPDPETINIVDIAHALARQCRFSGHIKTFYSVAEHSVRVSRLCHREHALAGLLHDASEAYLVDLPSPVKHHPAFEIFREYEDRLQNAIYARFDLTGVASCIKEADAVMLSTEARDLMATLHPDWALKAPPLSERLEPWTTEEAEDRFLETFAELMMRSKATYVKRVAP